MGGRMISARTQSPHTQKFAACVPTSTASHTQRPADNSPKSRASPTTSPVKVRTAPDSVGEDRGAVPNAKLATRLVAELGVRVRTAPAPDSSGEAGGAVLNAKLATRLLAELGEAYQHSACIDTTNASVSSRWGFESTAEMLQCISAQANASYRCANT